MENMRQIKFRAWLVKEKRMVDVMSLGFNKGYGAEEIHVDVPDFDPYEEIINHNIPAHRKENQTLGMEWYVNKPDLSPFEIMQATGLKDKNDKEIFEGDIVAVYDYNGPIDYDDENDTYSESRPTREIKWNPEGGFTLEWDYGDFDITLLGWAMEQHELQLEVIGNIYESNA